MEKIIISTDKAPAAIGPYSQGVRVGNMLFISGQGSANAISGEFINANVKKATIQVLENIKAILEEAGGNLGNVVKTTIFLKDMNDFVSMNEVYATYFTEQLPARSTIQAARLPKDMLVEIEAIAILS
jgi:2-iminobutanoate/2-iminopropanoate deaminase